MDFEILPCILLMFFNTLFSYRTQPVTVSSIFAQIVIILAERFMEIVLPERPVRIPLIGLEFSLNPGPLHVLIRIFANVGVAFGGLSRSQVSNWFINARVRLWKPMVEDMYVQELKASSDMNATTRKTKENESRNKTESPLGDEKNINKHGKMMLDGGVSSDKQSSSEYEGSKVDDGGSTLQTGQESSGTTLSIPLESQFRSGDKVDGTREVDMYVNTNRFNVDSLSSINVGPTIVVDRKLLDKTHGCINFEQGMKRFRPDLDGNRFQGYDNTSSGSILTDRERKPE